MTPTSKGLPVEDIDIKLLHELRKEFIPRESLDIKFHHITSFITKLQITMETMPKAISDQLERRLNERIAEIEAAQNKLEAQMERADRRMDRMERLMAYAIGGLFMLQIVVETFKDSLFKK